MSLYQKYRPRDFDSLYGQEFVKLSLQNALLQNKTVGAYLFYGSRGTGKTTVARIMAKGFNCLDLSERGNPCLNCINCISYEKGELLDVIEIDAASNTGVDNIRELIEKAQFQPNQARYKVYIIDEVHMLSKGAFNALLKILEEPPSHVKFILATTEIHKIPETIISRTQRYDFKRIKENDIIERLFFVAESENISAEKEALGLIARLSRGGLRDALTLFEQYSIGGKISLSYLMENLQLVGDEFLDLLITNLIDRNKDAILENLDFLKSKNVDIKVFIEEISFFLRDRIIKNIDINVDEFLEIFSLFENIYSKLKSVPNTFICFEIEIIKFLNGKIENCNNQENINFVNNNSIKIQSKLKTENYKSKTLTDFNINSNVSKENIDNKADDFEDIFDTKNDLLENQVFGGSTSEDDLNSVKEGDIVNDLNEINFDLNIFFDSIKKDTGKGFVLMSLKNAKIEYVTNNRLIIKTKTDFDLGKLNTSEIKSYLQEKMHNLFGVKDTLVDICR